MYLLSILLERERERERDPDSTTPPTTTAPRKTPLAMTPSPNKTEHYNDSNLKPQFSYVTDKLVVPNTNPITKSKISSKPSPNHHHSQINLQGPTPCYPFLATASPTSPIFLFMFSVALNFHHIYTNFYQRGIHNFYSSSLCTCRQFKLKLLQLIS